MLKYMRLLTGNRNHRFSDKEHKGYLSRQKVKRSLRARQIEESKAISKYKGIKLICGWTKRNGREAFIITSIGDKIVWIPEEYVRIVTPGKHVLKKNIDIDQYFEEAGYPVEHIQLKIRIDREKKRKS